jgi:Domain of unknown function (DUF397)
MAATDHVVTTWRKSSYSAPNGSNCAEVATAWRKSRHGGANGSNCAEVATAWRKSRHSGGNGSNCAEVAASGSGARVILVRDTKNGTASLEPSAQAWRHFAATLKRA